MCTGVRRNGQHNLKALHHILVSNAWLQALSTRVSSVQPGAFNVGFIGSTCVAQPVVPTPELLLAVGTQVETETKF